MAQSLFADMVKRAGLAEQFEIDSAATSREEIGNPPHYGTVQKLREEGIPLIPHRARQMSREDYIYYDYLIGMDRENIRGMLRIAGGEDGLKKIYKMLSFGPDGSLHEAPDVADPWYTGDFDKTFSDVKTGCENFLAYLRKKR